MAEGGEELLIVIPALNEQDHIGDVIASLQADKGCSRALIILADGGSQDGTVSIVERMGSVDSRVVAMPTSHPLGISASINRAVERFGHRRKWLVRIDAHAEYPSNYVSCLTELAVEHGATAVVTPMLSRGTTCFQRAAASAQNSFLGTGGSAHRTTGRGSGWIEHGHHALMSLEIFAAIGGYDETFSHNEDAELDHRILQSGGRIWMTAELLVIYHPRRTIKSLARQYFYYGRGRAMTVARHPKRRRLRQVLPLAIAPIYAVAFISPFHWVAALPVLAWASLCLGYGLVLARRDAPCAAGAGIAAIIMQTAWSFGYWKQLVCGPRPGALPAPLKLED